MLRVTMFAVTLALAAPLPAYAAEAAGPAVALAPDLSDTEKALASLYEGYFAAANAAAVTGDFTKMPDQIAYAKAYFTGALAEGVEYVMTKVEGGFGADIILNAQDFENLKLIEVAPIKSDMRSPRFDVKFSNFGTETVVRVTMVKEGAEWRIADMDYGDGLGLAAMIEEAKKEGGG